MALYAQRPFPDVGGIKKQQAGFLTLRKRVIVIEVQTKTSSKFDFLEMTGSLSPLTMLRYAGKSASFLRIRNDT